MRARLLGPVAAGLVVAAYAAALRRYGVFDFADEGLLLVQAARAAHGQVPYVDFHTGYGALYFRLAGELVALGGLAAVRWALVAVHGLTAGLTFALARRLAGPGLAWVAVALEVAFFLPIAPRLGAPFNVPYPAWPAALLTVAAAVVLGGGAGVARAAAAGALGGLALALKPNSGLCLAAGAAVALALGAVRTGPPGRAARLVPAAAALGALVLLAPAGVSRAALVLAPPLLALALLAAQRGAPDREVVAALAVLGAGFAVVGGTGIGPSLVALGPERFAREVLLLGGGAGEVARLYGIAPAWSAVGAALAAPLALVAVGGRARGPAWVALVGGVGALAAAAVSLALTPSRAWVARALAEDPAQALVPLAVWGGLALLGRNAERALAAATAVAAWASLQLYPRADFVHLMPLAPLLLPLVLRLWQEVALLLPLPGRLRAPITLGVPLLLALLRFAPTVPVLTHLAAGGLEVVRAGDATLVIEPAGAARLRALAEAVSAVEQAAPPDAPLLAFPACGLVPFLAGRLPEGPHDYFFPGRPTRAEVAALSGRLLAALPPVAVTCDVAGTDLAPAWDAFPELTALIAGRYRPLVERREFVVHVRRP